MQTVEAQISISRVINRLTGQFDQLQREYACLRWWQWRDRHMVRGAQAMLRIEIMQLEQLAGSTQPILRDSPRRDGPGMQDRKAPAHLWAQLKREKNQ